MALADLLNPQTADQLEATQLAALASAGFPTTAWQPGSVPRTLVRIECVVLATLWGLVALVAAAAFLDTATGAWLTLHAASRFDLTRIPASFARHSITLNCVSTAGPYNILVGQLLVTTAGGVRFRSTNTSVVVVPSGGSVSIIVQAETAGIAGNTAPSSIVTPANAGMTMSYGSLTLRARDEETDPQLRMRCRARWATRAAGATRAYYLYHLLNATMDDGGGNLINAGVTRVGWIAPTGDGTFEVIVAGADGPLSGPQLTAVTDYITDVTRRGYTDTPTVTNAVAVNVTPDGDFYVRSGFNTLANRTKAVHALVARGASLEIGQKLDIGAIYAAIYAADNVTDVALSTPSGDTSVTARQVVTIVTTNVEDSSNWHET